MENQLHNLLKLDGKVSKVNSDNFIFTMEVNSESIPILKNLYECNLIEEIKAFDGKIVNIDNISKFTDQLISIEFVISELKKIGFYLTLNDFIIDNRFEIPTNFYISDLRFQNTSNYYNEDIVKYNAVTTLIYQLTTKSKFISEEHNKTLYLVHENSFIEIPVENIVYEEFLENKNIDLIKQYIEDINSYKEKRTIFIKELIDFLTNKTKTERLKELILYFSEFYDRCNTSFEYYLSNFSFNKIKLDLDNSVLEYSKNIRSIINDSQSKLIAIPAAFILGVSQINYSDPLSLKNILIVASAFLFSFIISVFIKNQQNAIVIISDNISNYKTNYNRSKSTEFEEEKDLGNLSALINNSFNKTEIELNQQEKRLKILQKCNWGISITLLLSILIDATIKYSANLVVLWQQLFK
jgi:hypothetical protein